MKYKGYDIKGANPSGGKAGRGCNKTTTIQVLEPLGADGSYLLKKSFSFNTQDRMAEQLRIVAVAKAKKFIDALVEEAK